MDVEGAPIIVLARSPSRGAPIVLARGRVVTALLFVLAATAVSALAAVRVADETYLNDFFFGTTRDPSVQVLIDSLGPERTAVLVYLIQRSFDAIVVAVALTPVFIWLLGSTAVHAGARLSGARRPFLPVLNLFAYATALTLIPSSAVTLAFGTGRVAGLVNLVCLVWLTVIVYRGVRAHYAVDGNRAVRILVIALVLFYFVPALLIVAAAVAIVVAALVLGYF